MAKKANQQHWAIKVFDRHLNEVKRGYFDGTLAQLKSHIKLDYRRRRDPAPSGAQRWFPASRYMIEARPNSIVFHFEEDSDYDS